MSILFWKLAKTLLITTIVLLVLLINYLFFAWLLSIIPTTPYPSAPQAARQPLYVSTNGVHVDVIVPVTALPEAWLGELSLLEGTRYLGVGWGDKGFYLNTPTWAELDWRVAFSAAFLPSPTLMHVTHYGQASSYWYQTEVTEDQLDDLLAFIEDSFKRDQAEQLILLAGKGYGSRDFFYEAKGSYSALYTCNVWANQALKAARVKTAIWAPFEWGIVRHLQPATPRTSTAS